MEVIIPKIKKTDQERERQPKLPLKNLLIRIVIESKVIQNYKENYIKN